MTNQALCLAVSLAALVPLQALARETATPLDFGLSLPGFGGAVLSSEGDNSAVFGGKVMLSFSLNTAAAGLASGPIIDGHLEHNFGQDVNAQGDGTILPVNTALAFPTLGGKDSDFSLTVTQPLGGGAALVFGKFNMLLVAEGTPLLGGGGSTTFQHLGLAAPASGVTPPYVFGGLVSFPVRNYGVTVFVYDPRNAQDSEVIRNPFSTGTTVSVSVQRDVAPGGLKGTHGIRLVYSNAEGTDFDSLPALALPPGTDTIETKEGYKYAAYSFQQYLSQDAEGNGWGVFAQVAVSDGNPNAIQASALGGLAGQATFWNRPADRWGVGVFYYKFSDDLKDGLAALGEGIRDEYGTEVFYDYSVTQNFSVAANLQVVRPGTPGSDTAVLAGLRARVTF